MDKKRLAEQKMLRIQRFYEDACDRASDLYDTLTAKQRNYLRVCGWVEERRWNDRMSMDYAYRLPNGKVWHTLRGALLKQKDRDRKARKK